MICQHCEAEKKDFKVFVSSVKIEKQLPEKPKIEKTGDIWNPHPVLGFLLVYYLYGEFGSEFNYELGQASIAENQELFLLYC